MDKSLFHQSTVIGGHLSHVSRASYFSKGTYQCDKEPTGEGRTCRAVLSFWYKVGQASMLSINYRNEMFMLSISKQKKAICP